MPAAGVGLAHAQQRGCEALDPPCPPGPPVTVSVQTVADTARASVVTVYFSVTGLTGGTYSATSTLDGVPAATPTWQVAFGGSAHGSVQLTLAAGAHTVAVSFCESGRSPQCDVDQTTVIYQPQTAPPAMAPPIATVERGALYQRAFSSCGGCANAVLSYQTPAFHSLDQVRSLTLTYSSARSAPTGVVVLDVIPNSTTTPERISLSLKGADGALITLSSGGTEAFYSAGEGLNRITAQFDASAYGSAPYPMTAIVRNWWGSSSLETELPVTVLINNQRSAIYESFGGGWSATGVSHISMPNGSVGPLAFIDGDNVVLFENRGIGLWIAPPGDASSAALGPNNTLERHFRDGSVMIYDAHYGMLKEVRDRLGNSTLYQYASDGRLAGITDPAGLVTSISWTGSPGTTSTATITTPGGRVTTIATDAAGRPIVITDPDGVAALSVGYTNDHITSTTDRLGATTTYTYDRFDQLASVTGPAVQTEDRGFAPSTTSVRSRELAMLPGVGLGSSAAPAARVLPDTAWLRITSQRGGTVQVLANGAGDPTMSIIVDALGKADTTTLGYDYSDELASVRSTNGAMVDYQWDSGLLSSVKDLAANLITFYNRNALGQVDTVLVNQHVVQQNVYTADGRSLLQSSTAGNATTSFTYDALGRVSTVTDGAQHLTSFTYEPTGFQNLASVTRNANETTQFAYDGYGRLASVTDAAGQVSTVGYDALNRTTSMSAPGRGTSTWAYDDVNRTRTFTDALGQSYHSALDAVGAVVDATGPANAALHDLYRYDSDGNMSSFTTRGGRNGQIAHDVLGRPTSITADGAPTTTIAYDPAGKWVAYANSESVDTVFVDGSGRVTRQVAVRGGIPYTLTSAFGPDGDRQSSTITGPSSWNGPRTVDFGTDTLGRPAYVGDFGGKGTTIGYNQDQQPQTITVPTGTTSSRLLESLDYLGNERLNAASFNMQSNVLNSWYAYDILDRLTTIGRGFAGDGRYRRVGYDPAGRVSQVGDTVMTGEHPIICPPDESEACYPDESQLIVTYTPALQESYSYDAVGNRTDHSAVVSAGNRLTSFNGYTLTYDDDGNLASKSGHGHSQIFTWNALGQLVQVATDGVFTTFGYDGLGRRTRKTSNGNTTWYLYDGDNLVMQIDGTGLPRLEFSYYPGVDHPHAVRQSTTGAVYYYVTEQPGHVTELVNQNNQVVNRYEYTPFGESISATEQVLQPFRFAGREFDSETGLYYNRARYYDPALGRFISEDPIGLEGGVDPYAYAGNDPVNFSDPSGTDCTAAEAERLTYRRNEDGDWVETRTCPQGMGTGGITVIGQLPSELLPSTPRGPTGPTGPTPAGPGGYPATPPSFAPVDGTRVAPPLDRSARMYRLSCQAGSIVTGWTTGAAGGRVIGAVWGVAKYGEAFADVGAVAGGVIGGLIGAEGIVTAPAGAGFGASAGRAIGYGAAAVYGARKGGQIFGTLGAAAGTFAALSCH